MKNHLVKSKYSSLGLAIIAAAFLVPGCFRELPDKRKIATEGDGGLSIKDTIPFSPSSITTNADGGKFDSQGKYLDTQLGNKNGSQLSLTDGGSDVPVAPTPNDDPALTDNGKYCKESKACKSGACVEGLCCNTTCGGSCQSCKEIHTGKEDGVCAPVSAAKDPYDSCLDERATKECGLDGLCDGYGGCRMVDTSHVCTWAGCSGAKFTPTSTCDGLGACRKVETEDCGAALCSPSEGCKKTCATASDCGLTSFCDAATKTCSAKKIEGKACKDNSECTSGFCVDGVCCKTACSEKCKACSETLTGQASGTCFAVKAATDPKNSCEEDRLNPCGEDGLCDGNGDCSKSGTSETCGVAVCNAGTFTGVATCDGKGACKKVSSIDCGAFGCNLEGCKKSCDTTADCDAGSFCDTTLKQCAAKKVEGKDCKEEGECTSGFCVDGVCCKTGCKEACSACSLVLTGAASGTCKPVKVGTDPKDNCAPADLAKDACGNDGECDGAGACRKANNKTECGKASCDAAKNMFTPASFCSGSGSCTAAKLQSCGTVACDATDGCQQGCVVDADCIDGYFCDSKKTCIPKKNSGTCTKDSECTKGNCVQGLCCDNLCPATPEAKCGLNGKCGTDGKCLSWPKGTACGTACKNTNQTTNKTCDGAGKCSEGAPEPCPNNLICANLDSCKMSCTVNGDCHGEFICSAGKCAHCGLTNESCCDGGACKGTGDYCNGEKCVKKSAPGGSCTAKDQCAAGECVSQKCCKNACATNTNMCGNKGGCNDQGDCIVATSGEVCSKSYCSGGSFFPEVKCDGKGGVCEKSTGIPCGNYACDSITGCDQPGVCKSNSDCASGKVCTAKGTCESACGASAGQPCCVGVICPGDGLICNTNTKNCDVDKFDQGSGCTSDIQCKSGNCADGFCCNLSCNGTCEACSYKLTGKADGTCSFVKAGTAESACKSAPPCAAATCDGRGGCTVAGSGVNCGANTCNNNLLRSFSCNGSGTCTPSDTSCGTNMECKGGSCVASKKENGVSCGNGTECLSGFCTDGVCCNKSSCGTCQSCNLNGAGTCSNVPAGQPDNECKKSACITGCNGFGECTINQSVTCTDYNTREYCDQSGNSKTENCSYGCLGGGCRDSSYATIGRSGEVTCHGLTCSTRDGCSRDNNGEMGIFCGPALGGSVDNFQCDGPNDCNNGTVCCYYFHSDAGEARTYCDAASNCVNKGQANVSYAIVCDPLLPNCPSGSCKATLNFSSSNIFTCK